MPDQLPIDIPEPEIPGEPAPDSLASKEVANYPKTRYRLASWNEKTVDLVLKVLLFGFVLSMNIWWTHRVLQLLWSSAENGSRYHLSDTVLVALVTTSLANFVALVAIVARGLFPSKQPSTAK